MIARSILAFVVILNGKFCALAMLAAFGLCAGCSGINSSHSVSPASFFLPGLLKADPPPDQPQPGQPSPTEKPMEKTAQS
jgi:hypothetical protein